MLRFPRTYVTDLAIAPAAGAGQAHVVADRDALTGPVLIVNAGSTGVKLRVVGDDGGATAIDGLDDAPADLAAVGHRVVYGGEGFTEPVVIDDRVTEALERQSAVAPLHNVPALRWIGSARERFPGVPQVAVFDTAFHAGMPDEAAVYPVPEEWRTSHGVRRNGFHGPSVEWAVERAAGMLSRAPADLRLVVCHLGGGASATAVSGGRSVDTTMGFSPLEGLMMATRAGTIDPDVPLHLILHGGMDPREVRRMLSEQSGLRALAGTADMREAERRAEAGDPRARLALAVHDHRLAAGIAGMTAALGGLDAVVFTGGVGEGSARVRAEAARRLAFLGLAVDPAGNAAARGDADVSASEAPVRTLVVHAREELAIARATRRAVASAAAREVAP